MSLDCAICKADLSERVFYAGYGEFMCPTHKEIKKIVRNYTIKCKFCGILTEEFNNDKSNTDAFLSCQFCSQMVILRQCIKKNESGYLSREKQLDLSMCIMQYFFNWTVFKCTDIPKLEWSEGIKVDFHIEKYLKT